ncbi:MAG: hypothetical protein RBU37_18700, partial [Myxococcota bacterium]|nr:hypothetical protein [Myxococcota bacterium]
YSVSKGVGLYEGTFPLVDYLQGPPPFSEFGQGKIAFDGDGKPQSAREYDTRFALMTPITDPQSPAHYLMVYAPGEAGEYRSFLDNEAKALIPIYLAAISMDAPLSAGRNPTSTPPEELFAQLAVDNLPAWRDIILQRVADLLQLMRFVEIVTIEPEVSPLGASIPLFANPLVLMGNGVGAQVAALAASVEGRIDTTVLAAPAGFLGGMLAERYQEEYATRFALAPGEVLDEDHPIVRLVLQPLLDPADPINFGPRLFLDPEPLPNDVFITLGTQDRVMPPRYVAAFAVSAGIPLIQPEAYTDELWEQAGIAPIPAPVVGNINEPFPNCERPVCAFTAGVLSYDDDHHLLFDNEDAITRYTNYIISAYRGIPLIDQAM